MLFTSIFYLLIALLPVAIYVAVIWATTPYGSIDLRKSSRYFITGILSIGILLTFLRLVPGWQNPVDPINMGFSIFLLSFIQIGLIEELCKWGSFKINEFIRGPEDIRYDSPIGTMFYCGISALGFSFIENVDYAIRYGSEILITRSLVSMLLHFLCGLIMGYWISASRIPTRLKNRSLLEVFFIRNPQVKMVVYNIMGIFCATFLHGLYDYNLFSRGHIVSNYLIILGGIITSYLASKDLDEKVKSLS
jgi:RsiW-degrading membrane proteinase PrsW (M82 family)